MTVTPVRCASDLLSEQRLEIAASDNPAGSRPLTRWWWLQGPFLPQDIESQLDWLAAHGFGGVEIAWLLPLWDPRGFESNSIPRWLGPEWTALVASTKRACEHRRLRCDFTFGSCWPFGGSHVGREHASKTFTGLSNQLLSHSWESCQGVTERIVDHLTAEALRVYSNRLMEALRPALSGARSALFCDSLEVHAQELWHPRLWDEFATRFGYRLEPFHAELDQHVAVRYDYRALIADVFLKEFFEEFVKICHENAADARVQCHGAPVDLLAAYAAVDVPESEAILFEPHFSRIAASAAALAGRPIVSCETFTCIYGFPSSRNPEPSRQWKRERLGDLRLLADAVIANGVNQIVWHGTPYNPPDGGNEFYASVHIGPDSPFASELADFNKYLETTCGLLRLGRVQSDLAAWLPLEDNWMAGRVPEQERTPAANHRWELRHVRIPRELESYQPLWVTRTFLADGNVVNGRLVVGPQSFAGLWIDCFWMDHAGLLQVARLADAGLPICLQRPPRQPGHIPSAEYSELLTQVMQRPNVTTNLEGLPVLPLLEGDDLPLFWSRRLDASVGPNGRLVGSRLYFFAHPECRNVQYPLTWDQSQKTLAEERRVSFRTPAGAVSADLTFRPGASLLVLVWDDGVIESVPAMTSTETG